MKKSIVTTLVAAALIGAAPEVVRTQDANEPELSCARTYALANAKQIEKRYLQCLVSDNDGVVESALGHVTQMKLCLANQEFPLVEEIVNDLLVSGRTPAIRAKAHLASLVYRSPEIFVAEQTMEFRTPRELFAALSERVSKTLLSYGSEEHRAR
jgi:hypothetical protein